MELNSRTRRIAMANTAGFDGNTVGVDSVDVSVLLLSGSLVAELHAMPSDTIASVKQMIHVAKPTASVHRQRLLCCGQRLDDTMTLREVWALVDGGGREDRGVSLGKEERGRAGDRLQVVLDMILVVDPNDFLASSSHIVHEVASSFEAMGSAMRPQLATLFEDSNGEGLPSPAVADILAKLTRPIS